MIPSLGRRAGAATTGRPELPRDLVAYLMAVIAFLQVEHEFALSRRIIGEFQQGSPPGGRVDLRGALGGRRNLRFDIEPVAGRCRLSLRVDEAITAREYLVIGLRQIGYQIAALVIGHYDACEFRREVLSLGDHPTTGFRPFRTGHDTADGLLANR